MNEKIIVGITGASGVILGVRLIEELLQRDYEVFAVVSDNAKKVMSYEMLANEEFTTLQNVLTSRRHLSSLSDNQLKQKLFECNEHDFFAPIASGSFNFKATIIAPCSMKSLAALASGYANSLIMRAADVALKEKRSCILLPRETPLNLIHLENMTRLKASGADIVLPVPGYYAAPQTIEDVNDFIVGKILSLLKIENNLFQKWGDKQ